MRPRILLVDDRPNVRLSLLLTLEAFGFDVSEAGDEDQALDRATISPVDVILTDLHMRGFNGRALITAVRARCATNPKIIVTMDDDRGRELALGLAEARAFGAAVVLRKPFSRQGLLDAIGNEPRRRQWPLQRWSTFQAVGTNPPLKLFRRSNPTEPTWLIPQTQELSREAC